MEEIEKIILYTYPASEKLTGSIRYPASQDEAKFSLTYAAAVALLTANFTLGDLYRAADMNAMVRRLIGLMEIQVRPELEDRKNMIRGARMKLILKDGTNRESYVEVPKGEKKFPLTPADMRRKLEACGEGLLTEKQQDRIFRCAIEFGEGTNLTDLFLYTVLQ
ncbi:MAG TPA: MmgE/PrpD family protein [Clostridiales bacterium]|nr:MmgE/PrpD family protein [Clostridiales bacterium]